MPISYYNQGVSGQGSRVLDYVPAGINEYTPSISINDNVMSDMLNVDMYRDSAYQFNGDTAFNIVSAANTEGKGSLLSILPIESSNPTIGTESWYALTYDADTPEYKIIKLSLSESTNILSYSKISDIYMSGASITQIKSRAVIFRTEAAIFYCFTFANFNYLHYVKVEGATETYGYITLPAEPRQVVAHANRVFMIDTKNKLWWCRAGDLFSWYSLDYDDDAIFTTTNMKGTAYTITNQPNVTRPVTITHTVTDTADTVGTLALVGTANDDSVQSETITPPAATGRVQSLKHYKTITSLTPAGWSQNGATPDTISMGWGPVGGFVQADAGVATIEKESYLYDMCVIAGAIYIFSANNIYIFQGTSYDNFTLNQFVTQIGIALPFQQDLKNVVVANDVAYFIYDNSVYEFDGNSPPNVISKPVISNGSIVNGMYGGINITKDNDYALAATKDYLFLYRTTIYTTLVQFKYSIKSRAWTKVSVVRNTDLPVLFQGDAIYPHAFVSYNMATMYCIFSQNRSSTTDVHSFCFSRTLYAAVATKYPYLVTKAFNIMPSDKGTLTEILLLMEGVATNKANVVVSYSTTTNGAFTTLATYTSYTFSGDIEVFSIPLPVSAIANVHHYRIKVEVQPIAEEAGATIRLYNIERRFRIETRSR